VEEQQQNFSKVGDVAATIGERSWTAGSAIGLETGTKTGAIQIISDD